MFFDMFCYCDFVGMQFNPSEEQNGQGNGLGLYVSKGYINRHFGNLFAVANKEGTGAIFEIELPCFLKEESKLLQRLHAPNSRVHCDLESGEVYQVANEESRHSGNTLNHPVPSDVSIPLVPAHHSLEVVKPIEHILIVDDATSTRKMLSRLLTSNGYTCSQACDGEQCVHMVCNNPAKPLNSCDNAEPIDKSSEKPSTAYTIKSSYVLDPLTGPPTCIYDLILMDYEMPVMNGPTAAATLKSLGFNVPIIGITGNVLVEDQDKFIAHGAYKVLAKPVDLVKLQDIILHLETLRG